MGNDFQEAMSKIDKAIEDNSSRIEAGRVVIDQCNDQLRILKKKEYALNKLKKDMGLLYLTKHHQQ